MKLNEILNKKIDYEVVKATASSFITLAKIGERHIKFMATNCDEGEWDVMFAETNSEGKEGTFKLTNSGNELEVFSMVKDSISELITRYYPESIAFTASKDSATGKDNRADAYERLLKRFKAPGYTFKRTKYETTGDIFRLTRE